jgi:mono/diheme cytochrome c family protein
MATCARVRRAPRALACALIAAACGSSAGCDWPWLHDMAQQPSPATVQGPRSHVDGAVPLAERGPTNPADGERVANPLASDGAAIANGGALYAEYCTPCHGTRGAGTDGAVAKYFPRVGDLRSPAVQQHGDGWFYAVITAGTATMPPFGHELDPYERWQIVRFVRTLAQ